MGFSCTIATYVCVRARACSQQPRRHSKKSGETPRRGKGGPRLYRAGRKWVAIRAAGRAQMLGFGAGLGHPACLPLPSLTPPTGPVSLIEFCLLFCVLSSVPRSITSKCHLFFFFSSLLLAVMASPPIALVTAGSAGLGATVASLLARNGMRVAINYHGNAERAAALVSQLQKETSIAPEQGRIDYHAIKADLASRADVQRLVEETVTVFNTPKIDVVFSNGGWTHMRNLMDLDDNMVDEDWDRCFTMNVKSHLWLMHAARPYLKAAYSEEDGAASFITTASLAGVKVSGSSLAYAVTKAAQLHLAKGLAQIAAPEIRVNSVSPGLLLTVRRIQKGPKTCEQSYTALTLRFRNGECGSLQRGSKPCGKPQN